IVNDLGAYIRSPIRQLGFVLRAEAIHLSQQIFQPVMRNLSSRRRINRELGAVLLKIDSRSRLQTEFVRVTLRQAKRETVAPFCNLDLHRHRSSGFGYTMYIQTAGLSTAT